MIKFEDVKEGERYPQDCLIALGKNIVGDRTWGYYLIFNSPIKKTKPYVDPNTFEPNVGLVKSRYIVRWSSGQRKIFFKKAVSPVS